MYSTTQHGPDGVAQAGPNVGTQQGNGARTARKRDPRPPSLKKALAGLGILNGKSAFQALTEVGYAESTARVPAANGLSGDQCIQAAFETWPEIDPKKLLSGSKWSLHRKLDKILSDPKALDGTRVSELAKTLDIMERWYGNRATDTEDDARGFVNRLEWLDKVRELAGAKGMLGRSRENEHSRPVVLDVETPANSAISANSAGVAPLSAAPESITLPAPEFSPRVRDCVGEVLSSASAPTGVPRGGVLHVPVASAPRFCADCGVRLPHTSECSP